MMSDLARSDVESRVLKTIKGFERIDPAKVGIRIVLLQSSGLFSLW